MKDETKRIYKIGNVLGEFRLEILKNYHNKYK